MFKDRLLPIVKKVCLPYLFVIITFYSIGAMLVLSSSNLLWVVTSIFAFASVVMFVFAFQTWRLMKKINIKRSNGGCGPIGMAQVDLNSSAQLLDRSFLIIASLKLGEVAAKLILEGVGNIEDLTLLFSILILAAAGILYSFIKVYDRIRLFKGISLDKPCREISEVQINKCAAIYEFFSAFAILVVFPVFLGAALYRMGDSIFAVF